MRFLQFEHKDIIAAIVAAGLSEADFKSVKRQGKIHLFYKEHAQPFKFFRKKETRLNAAGQWEKRDTYLLFGDGKSSEADGWKGVMVAFEDWLARL